MGKRDKKSSKGRLDKYYHLAKEQGYRARSAFKLIQLNKKYEFLEKSRVLIDLCAAPGGWLQVATKYMPTSSLIIGVDLAPIKPIPNVITFQDDITSDKCRQHLRQEMKTWKADVVLHDGAPNVGTAWAQDAFSQSELVLSSLKLATEFLRKGGIFVTKVFRSKDYNKLMWIFQQLFGKVEATKPASSRNVSAEIFVVCRDYIAPKKIDPRLLDAKTVFEEVDNDGPQTVNDIFKSSKKKTRQRQGYEDGNYTLFKKLDVWEFIKSDSPVVLLGTYNMFDFESDESKELLKKDITTEDIKVNCADLKVLGKRDFKTLLKWRLAVRKEYKMDEEEEKQDEIVVEEEEPMDEDEKLRMELENLTKEEARKLKKQKRKAMAMKMKAIHRAEMHMITPTDIGMEQAHTSMDSLFNIKQIKKNDALEKLQEGDMSVVDDVMDELDSDVDMDAEVARQTKGQIPQYVQALDDSDYDEDLEAQLDEEYERYKERRAEKDPKFKAKLNRAQNDEWHEFDGKNKKMDDDSDSEDDSEQDNDEDEGQNATSSDEESDLEISRLAAADDDDDEDDEDDVVPSKSSKGAKSNGNALIRDLGIKSSLAKKTSSGLTLGASMFFDQDIFKGVDGLDEIEDQEGDDKSDAESSAIKDQVKSIIGSRKRKAEEDLEEEQQEEDEELEDDDDFEIVGNENIAPSDEEMWDGAEDENSKAVKQARETGLNTVEAIHLARQLANKEKTKNDLIDDGFTKEAFRDKEGLPAWFLDDENKHNRPHLPVTKEAVRAFREKMKLINAQPIKKIREAKARKKHKAVKRLERAQKKAEAIVENEDLTEKEKAQNINRLIARATKSKPKKEVKLVVAKGANRGIKGRPKGVKGRYKMVDRRMKKDLRAQKRREKKKGRK